MKGTLKFKCHWTVPLDYRDRDLRQATLLLQAEHGVRNGGRREGLRALEDLGMRRRHEACGIDRSRSRIDSRIGVIEKPLLKIRTF